MIIRYSDGSYVEGVIHTLEHGILRATVAGRDDATEYTLGDGGWISEMGDGVTFEFCVQGEVDLLLGVMGAGEPECAAGGACVLRRMPGLGPVLVN